MRETERGGGHEEVQSCGQRAKEKLQTVDDKDAWCVPSAPPHAAALSSFMHNVYSKAAIVQREYIQNMHI